MFHTEVLRVFLVAVVSISCIQALQNEDQGTGHENKPAYRSTFNPSHDQMQQPGSQYEREQTVSGQPAMLTGAITVQRNNTYYGYPGTKNIYGSVISQTNHKYPSGDHSPNVQSSTVLVSGGSHPVEAYIASSGTPFNVYGVAVQPQNTFGVPQRQYGSAQQANYFGQASVPQEQGTYPQYQQVNGAADQQRLYPQQNYNLNQKIDSLNAQIQEIKQHNIDIKYSLHAITQAINNLIKQRG